MRNSFTAHHAIWQTAISGTVTKRELLDLENRIKALDEDGPLAPCGIVDLRGVIELDTDLSTLNSTIDAVKSRHGQKRIKTAILVDNPAQYSLARMIGLFRNRRQVEIRIFEDEDDALKWVLDWSWCPLHSTMGNNNSYKGDQLGVAFGHEDEVHRSRFEPSDPSYSVT